MALESGDMLLYYTDGVVEAANSKNELFGFDRLEAITNKYGHLSAGDFLSRFKLEFKEFIKDEVLHDDYTIVAIKIT